MLKEIQDLLKKAEAEHPGLALRVQVTTDDVRVSGFGRGDMTYNTAVKVEFATLPEIEHLIVIVVSKLTA